MSLCHLFLRACEFASFPRDPEIRVLALLLQFHENCTC
ncbi:hypothetical protein T4A_6904 [Trichinella pseudospiralis]|uniref:Uncharacterized protein n=1 Tax=Trichinella pseudospiralis TaxID=6337 RepID=A0A0V1AMT0_TRIPS|nr:hypothetical protein T4A_6904 [Trichinella pseudospiralis]